MCDNNFEQIYESIRASLPQREYVSVPELQATLGISYTEAKLAVNKLKAEALILEEADGMKYPVCIDVQQKRALSSAEAVYLRSRLSDSEVMWLKALGSIKNPKSEFAVKYKILFDLDLVRFSRGRVVYAIDEPSVSLLCSFSTVSEEWFVAVSALEIASGIQASGSSFNSDEYTIISDVICNMVDCFLNLPSLATPAPKCGYSMGKFELIESFITKNDFTDIESYRKKAKSELSELKKLGVKSGVILDTVAECITELDDLTYENIEEIRKLIAD